MTELIMDEFLESSKIKTTPLKISTITVTANLNSRIDLDIIELKNKTLQKPFNILFREAVKLEPNKRESKRPTGTGRNYEKKFFNSMKFSLVTEDSPNISCKLFSNGKIQITGCRSIETSQYIPKFMWDTIKDIFTDSIVSTDTFKLTSEKIELINSNFKIIPDSATELSINQQKLKNIINTYLFNGKTGSWYSAVYHPDNNFYGINAKYIPKYLRVPSYNGKGNISVFIFRTGAISIHSAKCTIDMFDAYIDIMTIINTHWDEIVQ